MKRAYDEIMERVALTPDMRMRVLRVLESSEGTVPRWGLRRHRMLAAAACFLLLLTGALTLPRLLRDASSDPPGVQVTPDIVQADSLEALSELVGFPVAQLESLPFAVDRVCYTAYWNELAEIAYNGNGMYAVYRMSRGSEDNSGDYSVYQDILTVDANGYTVTLKGNDGAYLLAVWTDGTFSYSLKLSDGIPQEEWEAVLSELPLQS